MNSETAMSPFELKSALARIVEFEIHTSLMIWGAPGIGKSSIVAQVAFDADRELVDLRLSQLAPTDLRGLPVPGDGIIKWFPPEFLPRDGEGILFLDEINMAPPALQGVAQQLILDRRVGSYVVPDGWFVWAAGNRKEDRASVFDMPAPLANRFLHFHVAPDFDSFKAYALANYVDEQLLAFLAFRPALIHAHSTDDPAWPSPRTWVMASQLKSVGMDIAPAVGRAVAMEFEAFSRIYDQMPDLDSVMSGASDPEFPDEPSAKYATVIGLVVRCADFGATSETQIGNAGDWLSRQAQAEWLQLFLSDLVGVARARTNGMRHLRSLFGNKRVKTAIAQIRDFVIE